MAHSVEILKRPGNQRRGHKLSFRFGSGSERWKITDCTQLFVCRFVSHSRTWSSSIWIESSTLNIGEESSYRFEFKCSIWCFHDSKSKFHDFRQKFRQNFSTFDTTSSSIHNVHFNSFCDRTRWSRWTRPFNRRKWWRESNGDFDDRTKFLLSTYRERLIYLRRHTVEHGLRASNAYDPFCRGSRWESAAIFSGVC